MPMIDIQRRHAEVFRIRLGDKGPKGEPRKLTDQIRVTSPNQRVVHSFTDVYGGSVTQWEKEWQAYLPTDYLRVLVLPGQSLQQWWESYSGSVCQKRCDGEFDVKNNKPCSCPADLDERLADKRACSPMTRVNVICPDVAVVGSGALVTHSMIAAETLPQSIAVAEAALNRGLMVPAVLRVVEHKGRTHYIVPQLEIVGVSLNELTSGEVTPRLHAVTDAPALPVGEAKFTPVPAEFDAPKTPIADQVAAPAKPKARKSSSPALPATGKRPRTTAEVESRGIAERAAAVKGVDPIGEDAYQAMKARVEALDAEHYDTVRKAMSEKHLVIRAESPRRDADDAEKVLTTIEAQQKEAWGLRQRTAFAALASLGLDDDARHQFVSDATDGATESLGKLTADQLLLVLDAAGAPQQEAS